MRRPNLLYAAIFCLLPAAAQGQDAADLNALRVLAPFSALLDSGPGKAALEADFSITGAIQNGTARQPGLQDFPAEQAQALRDATATAGNGWSLADGLGSKLGTAYQSLTSVAKPPAGSSVPYTSAITPELGRLFAWCAALAAANAESARYFFADERALTQTGSRPVSSAAAGILQAAHGVTDVFGKAYGRPAGTRFADPMGNSRPFQTEPNMTFYSGPDLFGDPSGNRAWLQGPARDLTDSPSFPGGQAAYGYMESLLFAIMVPERYPQMVTRAAEYGNGGIIIGANYAMDVIGGRTIALFDLAHLLAEDPAYLGRAAPGGQGQDSGTISRFGATLHAAALSLRAALVTACREGIAACAAQDIGRFASPPDDEAFYESTQTYGLPAVYPGAEKTEDVGKLAPDAGYLLTAAFPRLDLRAADRILTETEGPGGGFLDDGSGFGLYSRLDLYRAALRAEAYR